MSDDIAARLDRIEGILRAARLHEEGCPLAAPAEYLSMPLGLSGLFASLCTCWLATPREETAP